MRSIVKIAIALPILCGLSIAPAVGKTYKCRDAEGHAVFSDTACNSVAREELKQRTDNDSARLDQEAIRNCLAYLKSSQTFPDPDSVKVAGSRFAWVAVKDVGSRRMLYLDLRGKNQYGVYAAAKPASCLMMGDGRTVNTYPYELLEKE